MSTTPFQVPTRDFMRSNSGEPVRDGAESPAVREPLTARIRAAQTETVGVFIGVCSLFVFKFIPVVLPGFSLTTNEPPPSGHRSEEFLQPSGHERSRRSR